MTMRRGRWWAAGLLVTGIWTSTPAAWAQGAPGKPATPDKGAAAPATPTPAPSPADADKESVRLFEDAKKAHKAFQWDKARDAALAAFKLKPDPAYGLILGQSELQTGKPRDAAEHLELFVREAKSATSIEKQAAQKLLDEAKGKLGTLVIHANVEGADVVVDGRAVGRTPLAAPVFVDPGSHEIEVKKFGFDPGKELLAVAPATESEMEFALAPLAAEPDKPEPEKKPKEEPKPPPLPSPKWRTYGMIGGAGLTVIGLGLGVGLTMMANSKSDEADQQLMILRQTTPTTSGLCGAGGFVPNAAGCAKLKDTLSSQDAAANGAIAGYVIGGVAAIGTLGLFLLPRTPLGRKLMGVNVVPVLGAGQTGGMVVGSF
ncbi:MULTISPECIES: PEGA domain-containing protein [Polyangium]|uniref:PEGA domain-containing protein n=2 Tax=Polyangium TaxID=55 RepID=A0A4U1JGM5_9BACT|nr:MULTISPECIES: PEGA domain-containing protein [Polyangium]MDI1435084.1 PEGA domain-containing protein [Polyangium sorediatum]TKD10465.1 PEGA domain-containing protein [Polyangium fumosum]